VIGVTGSGKTTVAAALALKLQVPHVELDALYWEPNWTMSDTEVFRTRVQLAVAGDGWVVDGNYSKARDLVWSRADSLVWLDYSLPVAFGRLFRRTIGRVRSRQELWNGNRERFAEQFLSRQSLFVWLLQSHRRYRSTIPTALAADAYAHLRVVRLRSPREARLWFQAIRRTGDAD